MAALKPGFALRLIILALCLVLAGAAAEARSAAPLAVNNIRVLSYNIRIGVDKNNRPAYPRIFALIAKQRPDIVIILESGFIAAHSAAQIFGLPYYKCFTKAYGNRSGSSGICVFSRWPLKAEVFDLAGTKKPRRFMRCWIDAFGLPLSLYAVHLSREGLVDRKGKGLLLEVLGGGSRMKQMESLIKVLDKDSCRFIVLAGDLNTFPLSAPYRLLSQKLQDAFPSVYTEGTYRESKGPSPKIDHIFHSPALKALNARVIKGGPSDHFAVMADFKVPPAKDRALPKKEIQLAQTLLTARRFYPGNLDGLLDPRTRKAIAQYQESQGLVVDGRLNRQTLKRLFKR